MTAQSIRIFYHSDVDGIFSAILYSKLLVDTGALKIKFKLSSVNYHLKDWQSTDLKTLYNNEQLVVVDFLYHPQVDFWCDHHQSGLGTFALEDVRVPGRYDPTAPSCAQVIFDTPGREKFKDEGLIQKVVQEVNIVDYALYPTIDYVYDSRSFGPVIRMALLEEYSDDFANELIRMCVYDRTSFYKLMEGKFPWSVEWRYNRYKSKLNEGYTAFKKVAQITGNVVHYTDPPYVKTDRYFGFRLRPDIDFVAYIKDFTWMGQGCHVGFSKNPWKEKRPINLKELAEKYGGGGHQDVAGITVESMEKAINILKEIVEVLQ